MEKGATVQRTGGAAADGRSSASVIHILCDSCSFLIIPSRYGPAARLCPRGNAISYVAAGRSAKRAAAPPVWRNTTASSGAKAPPRMRAMKPASALPVYTGSARTPSRSGEQLDGRPPAGRRRPVAGAQGRAVDDDLRSPRCAARRSRVATPFAMRSTSAASSSAAFATAKPWMLASKPSLPKPASMPACVPPVAVARTIAGEPLAETVELLREFLRRKRVADGAARVGAADGDEVWHTPEVRQRAHQHLDPLALCLRDRPNP